MDIGAGQGHELISLLHQLVGKGLDDKGFAAAGRSIEKEGLHRGNAHIFVQGIHADVPDAVRQQALDLLHAGYLIEAITGIRLIPMVYSLLGNVGLFGGGPGGRLGSGRLLDRLPGVQLGPDLAHLCLTAGLIVHPILCLGAGGHAGQLAADLGGPLVAESLLPAGYPRPGNAVRLRLIDIRAVFVVQTVDVLNIHTTPPDACRTYQSWPV